MRISLLVPEEMAVDEINAITDVEPITRKMLTAIVREFTGKAPPYASSATDGRVVYMRELMRKRRAVSKNGTLEATTRPVPKLLTRPVDSKRKNTHDSGTKDHQPVPTDMCL